MVVTNKLEKCDKKVERFDNVSCEGCEDHIDPKDGIEIIERLTGLNQG